MADDIVTRLREQAEAPALAWLAEAADEIERLHAEVSDLSSWKTDAAEVGRRQRDELVALRAALRTAPHSF